MLKHLMLFSAVASAQVLCAAPVLPGYLTDPSVMKGSMAQDASYQPPARLKYPYISTYYVKPTVKSGDAVKISIFVTDFDSSKIRFLDDSHVFTAYLEYGLKGCEKKIVNLANIKSGDSTFNLGALPVGEYEMRVWAVDQKGRESHRVIHDFRVVDPETLKIPADKVYKMTEADLAAYGIRNDGDFEKIVYVSTNGTATVMKEKRAGVPGYTVTVPMDPKTDKLPFQAFKVAKVAYDEGYDKTLVATNAVLTSEGLQKLLDDKAAAGFRKLVMLPGTYRVSFTKKLSLPDHFTLDLGKAVLKQDAFTGAGSLMVNLSSTIDSHLIGGTLEGDYWTHDYAGSPNNSEWPAGFQIGGDSWYSTVEGVKVVDITGYGGQNGIAKDAKGGLSFFYEGLPKFAAGGLDAKTGEVKEDKYRFTSDFKPLKKITDLGRRRLQVSKYLGYQGRATRSWQMTVAWYDAEKKFLSAEIAWQYREMWIPEGAEFLRVSIEEEDEETANKTGLTLTAMRLPVNCAVVNCTFDHCRCVGYAASAMKNFLFGANFFTHSGESAARCAFDAEDGWDQMQDAYFYKNVFRDNPMNNSILTCAGHNFILEKNDGDVYFWGRTHSPCVRGNKIHKANYRCDSRLRSGYGRFEDNTYSKGVHLGENEGKNRTDNWDYVLSGLELSGADQAFNLEVGCAGRLVNCTFKDMPVAIANAYACTFENCTDGSTYKPFPGGNWFEVTLKNCKFNRFYNTNNWDRCHFVNTQLNGFNRGSSFVVKNSDFTDCSFFGFSKATLKLSDCTLTDTKFEGNWWEPPSNLLFKNCTIKTKDNAPFLKIAGYTIGKVGFDGCKVSGNQPLFEVKDLRRLQMPPNTKPEDSPDLQTGTVAIRGTKWESESKTVVKIPKSNDPSPKKIQILDKENAWPEGVAVAEGLPPSWELK